MRSIFLCTNSMLILLDVCKAAYVSQGKTMQCDEKGSELSTVTMRLRSVLY
jgi:hypothetical protein